ncbi:hypothetical protein BJY01DRAFT_244251 [Aspergillus pseudoustus]|uniref:Uncharacterized protein n=1 Tax=Aspergillus pseudoustus TaxID=1810923 RepID=A0ABR4KLY0_9EURO
MKPPMDSRTQNAHDTFLKLGLTLSPIPAAEDKEAWQVEENAGDMSKLEHMEAFFEDCQLVFNTGPRDERLIPRRLPIILFGVLAKVKREHHQQLGDQDLPRRPQWLNQTKLQANVIHEGKRELVETPVDYTLVYGRREKLAFNLVVLRENSLNMQDKTWEALTAMGTVQRARPLPSYNTGVYGLHTNSYEWHFLHLSAGGEYSALRLSWDTDRPQIIALLLKTSKQAVDLAQKAGGVNLNVPDNERLRANCVPQ